MISGLLLLLATGCAPEPLGTVVDLRIGDRVGEVDPRFLSVAVDLGQVVGSRFWNPDADAEETEVPVAPYDLSRPGLKAFAAALAPGVLRVGGTESDRLFYADGDAPDPLPDGYDAVLELARWDDLADFATEAGLDLMFTWNDGPGPRLPDGSWDPAPARRLAARAAGRGDPLHAWELGNEPNGFRLQLGFGHPPEAYAADVPVAVAVRDELTPGVPLVGASVAFWPEAGEIVPYLEPTLAAMGGGLDAITWHYYPQQGRRCPVATRAATPELLQEPEALDEVAVWAAEVERLRDLHLPEAEVWLGESGNAQCGGEPGVSDTWASTAWWVDQLGLLARRGHRLAVRQNLSGSDYGLLDDDTLALRPDAWASLIWKRVMGSVVVDVQSADPDLRAYAHCHPEGGLSLALINLADVPLAVEGYGFTWNLASDELQGDVVRLNDRVLAAGEDGRLPDLAGQEQRFVDLPPRGIAFHRIVDDRCPEER